MWTCWPAFLSLCAYLTHLGVILAPPSSYSHNPTTLTRSTCTTLVEATSLIWVILPIFCFIFLLFYLLSYHLQSIFIIRIRMNILKCKPVSATSLLRGLHCSTCISEKIQSTGYGLLSPIWPDLNSIPLLTLPIAHPSLLCHVINIPGLFFLWGHCVGNFLCPQSYFPIIDMIYSYFRSYRNWKCSIPVFRHFLQLWHKHMV